MRARTLVSMFVFIGVVSAGAPARVLANHPFHERTIHLNKFNLVDQFDGCAVPNSVTVGGSPACDPPVQTGGALACRLGPTGHGVVLLKTRRNGALNAPNDYDDLRVRAHLVRLPQLCVGHILTLYAVVRGTLDTNCIPNLGNGCTTIDLQVALGSCTIAAANSPRCVINTTINTVNPFFIVPGLHTVLQLGAMYFRDTDVGNLVDPDNDPIVILPGFDFP